LAKKESKESKIVLKNAATYFFEKKVPKVSEVKVNTEFDKKNLHLKYFGEMSNQNTKITNLTSIKSTYVLLNYNYSM